jgi:hypothetical protein
VSDSDTYNYTELCGFLKLLAVLAYQSPYRTRVRNPYLCFIGCNDDDDENESSMIDILILKNGFKDLLWLPSILMDIFILYMYITWFLLSSFLFLPWVLELHNNEFLLLSQA